MKEKTSMREGIQSKQALRILGILFLTVGFGIWIISTLIPPTIQNCEGAQGYFLDKEKLSEVTIDLKPDCWSGKITVDQSNPGFSYNRIYWLIDNTKPYEVLYADGHIEQLNEIIDGRIYPPYEGWGVTVQRPTPVRFRGTGKLKISAIRSEVWTHS